MGVLGLLQINTMDLEYYRLERRIDNLEKAFTNMQEMLLAFARSQGKRPDQMASVLFERASNEKYHDQVMAEIKKRREDLVLKPGESK